MSLIKANGHFINVNLPDWNYPAVSPFTMFSHQVFISGSAVGSPSEIEGMLEFAAKTGVKPWITTYPMSEVNKAIEDFRAGKPRFRFVLEN